MLIGRFRATAAVAILVTGLVGTSGIAYASVDYATAKNDAYTIRPNELLVIPAPGVLGNDVSNNGIPIEAKLLAPATYGTGELLPDGSLVYQPSAAFTAGTDTFDYCDVQGSASCASNVATVTITVVNDAPAAAPDAYETTEGRPLVVAAPGVLGNDSDPDGDALTADLDIEPDHGVADLQPDGSFTYTPEDSFVGEDSFSYFATDEYGYGRSSKVTITVVANQLPVTADDAYSTEQDTALVVAAPGVLDNDADGNGDQLTVSLDGPGPNHGTLNLRADGSLRYVPDDGFAGTDSFDYAIADGYGGADYATVVITVTEKAPPTTAPPTSPPPTSPPPASAVVPPANTPSAPTPAPVRTLAYTGVPTAATAGVGVLLLLLGVMLVAIARRRQGTQA